MVSELIQSNRYKGVKHRIGKDGEKTYYVNYTVNGRSYNKKIGKHSEGFRENFCNIKRTELINEAKNGSVIDKRIVIDELAELYHETKQTNSTHGAMLSRYDYKIKPFFKNKAVRHITEEDVRKFQKELMATKTGSKGKGKKLMADATVNYYVQQVQSLLIYGVSKGYLQENVARNVKPLKLENARERFLGIEELNTLAKALEYDEDLLMFVEMSMSTGGRMGSVMKIQKKDINLSSKRVMLSDEKGKERYPAFLNARVLKLLEKKLEGLGINDNIYNTKQRAMQRQMKKVLDRLFNVGLEKDDAKQRVVIHTLRHTFASHLAINGAGIYEIKTRLNHKDLKHTARYAHLSPDSGRKNVEGIW